MISLCAAYLLWSNDRRVLLINNHYKFIIENSEGVIFTCTVKDWENYLDTVGVSLSVGITRQVAHGTLLIFGDGLLF